MFGIYKVWFLRKSSEKPRYAVERYAQAKTHDANGYSLSQTAFPANDLYPTRFFPAFFTPYRFPSLAIGNRCGRHLAGRSGEMDSVFIVLLYYTVPVPEGVALTDSAWTEISFPQILGRG